MEVYDLVSIIGSLTLLLRRTGTHFQESTSYKIDLLESNNSLQSILKILTIKYV